MRLPFLSYVFNFFLFFLCLHPIFAQNGKKSFKDFIQIKAPAINYAVPDTANLLEQGLKEIILEKKVEYYFDPERRDFSMLLETDTNRVDPNDFSIVEVDEEFNFDENDSLWIKIAEYYSVWDNRAVNPYGVDVTKFTDTIPVVLYDSTEGRYWASPLSVGYLTDDFGPRRYRWHYGVDLKLDTGDSVYAVWDGVVRICKYDHAGYGYYVLIRHYNGLETIYGHLSRQLVKVGDVVKAGDLIGLGGSTGRSSGPHLHFEIRYQGHAIDPELFWDFSANKLMWKVFHIMPSHFDYVKKYRKIYIHRVKRGETLVGIASKYGVPVKQILRLNGISMRTTLKPGRRLRIR